MPGGLQRKTSTREDNVTYGTDEQHAVVRSLRYDSDDREKSGTKAVMMHLVLRMTL
jgi:hypothetical protein